MDSTLERAPRRLEMCRLRKLTAALDTPEHDLAGGRHHCLPYPDRCQRLGGADS